MAKNTEKNQPLEIPAGNKWGMIGNINKSAVKAIAQLVDVSKRGDSPAQIEWSCDARGNNATLTSYETLCLYFDQFPTDQMYQIYGIWQGPYFITYNIKAIPPKDSDYQITAKPGRLSYTERRSNRHPEEAGIKTGTAQ